MADSAMTPDIDPPVCPSCESTNVSKSNVAMTIGVGAPPSIEVPVTVPVWVCGACNQGWQDYEAEEIISAAIRAHPEASKIYPATDHLEAIMDACRRLLLRLPISKCELAQELRTCADQLEREMTTTDPPMNEDPERVRMLNRQPDPSRSCVTR